MIEERLVMAELLEFAHALAVAVLLSPQIVYLGRYQPQGVVLMPSLSGSGAGALGAVLGHADRQQPMHDYCLGLLMPIERKSVEPTAAVTAPAQVAAKHQSLRHFVGNAPWSDAAMLDNNVRERSGPLEAWIIDDTGFPKSSGTRSG